MKRGNKQLLVIGDRILVAPKEAESRTKVGLLLPATVVEKEEVQSGTVVAVGPGIPLPPPQDEPEPWKESYRKPRYLHLQVVVGDHAVFFRKAAVEITFEGEQYLVVPHSAILVVIRGADVPDQLPETL